MVEPGKDKALAHLYVTHTRCEEINCLVCVGGLAICEVCGLAEGSLTTHCPGTHCTGKTHDAVYNGTLDYVSGEWVRKAASGS